MNNHRAFIQITDEIANYFNFIAQAGFKEFDCSEKTIEMIDKWGKPDVVPVETLAALHAESNNCQRCNLWQNRQTIVFGDGNPHARLVFIGEAPGMDEDRQGLPFVGAAGQLLTRIIQAMKLKREDVYICNIIKCHPPQNRNPLPEEINACAPFLKRQIKAIQPDYICTLGAFATQTILQTDRPISHLRGRFHSYEGIQVMPTFHPAFLLRNPGKKRDVWEDMQKLMRMLAIET
ncbi:uracil-DNA glycosylase [Desulfococcaceae bacterium HSG7]|nr:uracil-DNA glycosylase [Desulfococcaceae bacterium HSG7]